MRRRPVIAILLCSLFCALAGFLALRVATRPRQSDEIELAIRSLVIHRHDRVREEEAMAEVVRFGNGVHPRLSRAMTEQDSKGSLLLASLRNRLPEPVARLLPEQPSKAEVRSAVRALLYRLGPAAARALSGGIGSALAESDDLSGMEVLRSLYWSVPDSAASVAALSNWLAHPKPGKPLFGMVDAREIWPAVPHLAPLLAPWLQYADTAREAAEGLGLMGTNALPTMPLLIATARHGCSGGPESARLHWHYGADVQGQIIEASRGAAFEALGRLGQPAPEIFAAFQEGLTNGSAWLRAASAHALGLLGSNAVPLLPFLLERLDRENGAVLRYQIEAIGSMGPPARSALPALASIAALQAGAEETPLGRIIRWHSEPLPLPQAAALAIAQIDPSAIADSHLAQLARALGDPGLPASAVGQLKVLSSALVPRVEANLDEGEVWNRIASAHNLLLLQPRHAPARELLRQMMKKGEPVWRSAAAHKYFAATGEIEPALATLRETMRSVVNLNTQGPLNILREFGPAARELAPQVQPLLSNPDATMRMLAGKALRSIAPEALPPIGEALQLAGSSKQE